MISSGPAGSSPTRHPSVDVFAKAVSFEWVSHPVLTLVAANSGFYPVCRKYHSRDVDHDGDSHRARCPSPDGARFSPSREQQQ